MAEPMRDRPAIHVCLVGPSAPGLYHWVEIGAEEEGLPTQHVNHAVDGVVAAAYAAAQSSRFAIGVAIGEGRVVLHEAHMPPTRPVLAFELGHAAPWACRLMGGNAARLVVRLPLRFADEPAETPETTRQAHTSPDAQAEPETLDAGEVARIVSIVSRILRERGIV